MKKTVFLILIFNISITVSAQEPNVFWTQTYGYQEDEECRSVKQTEDGGFILVGHSKSFSDMNWDIYIVKTDSLGNLDWDGHYGNSTGNIDDQGFCIIEVEDGYMIGGMTEQYDADGDMYLLKLDRSGSILWDRYYHHGSGPTEDCCYALQNADAGYILGGYWVYYTVGMHIWSIKVNEYGYQVWDYSDFPGSGYSQNVCRSVIADDTGNYILAGHRSISYTSDKEAFLIKLNENGDVVWTGMYGTDSDDYCYSHVQLPDRGFMLAGSTQSLTNNSMDCLVIKADSLGEYIWHQTYGEEGEDVAHSIIKSPNQGYIVGGETNSFGANRTDMYVFQIDSSGNPDWNMLIGGDGDDICLSVISTREGDYILGGYTNSYGAGSKDMYLVCLSYDSLGVTVTNDKDIPEKAIELNLCPNPFNQRVALDFALPAAAQIKLTVYDNMGREVANLVDGYKSAGSHEIIFDAKDLTSGVYFAKLEAGGFRQTRKILLIK